MIGRRQFAMANSGSRDELLSQSTIWASKALRGRFRVLVHYQRSGVLP